MNNNLSIHPPWIEKHTGCNLTFSSPPKSLRKIKWVLKCTMLIIFASNFHKVEFAVVFWVRGWDRNICCVWCGVVWCEGGRQSCSKYSIQSDPSQSCAVGVSLGEVQARRERGGGREGGSLWCFAPPIRSSAVTAASLVPRHNHGQRGSCLAGC